MSLGTATSMEFGSLLTKYLCESSLALSSYSKTSAEKLIWSLNKSFPKNLSTIIYQSMRSSRSSTNLLLYSVGTFQKLTPVAKSEHNPCFILSKAYL